jgi:hypothetical protein
MLKLEIGSDVGERGKYHGMMGLRESLEPQWKDSNKPHDGQGIDIDREMKTAIRKRIAKILLNLCINTLASASQW